MSNTSKQASSGGYYKGVFVGIVLTITALTVFKQITGSVNIGRITSMNENTSPFQFVNKTMSNVVFNAFSEHSTKVTNQLVVRPLSNRVPEDKISSKTENIPELAITNAAPTSLNASTLLSEQQDSRLSRTQCAAKYGKRTYFPESEKRLPPMLYTFPGSGNTWCRLLIEYSTGIYSGAVYNDDKLLEALPGEFTCNHRVSVVKVHPHTHGFEELRTGTFNSDNNKCKKGEVQRFKRAILLIRNPFDSIWSEFQRRVTKSHVSGISRQGFDWHRWQANAASLSHMYYEMWAQHHAGIEKHFPKEDILYIKYEDLKSKQAGTKTDTMKQVTDFLKVPTGQERLGCAFVLAENRDAHRTIDATLSMTKNDAYTKELTCRMWALFGSFAEKHGYRPINGFDCSNSSVPKIHRVNVGAQGEYDMKWVRPGAKLIDFGGYDKSLYAAKGGTEGGGNMPGSGGGGGGGGGNGGGQKRLKMKRQPGGGGGGGGGGNKRMGGGDKSNNNGGQQKPPPHPPSTTAAASDMEPQGMSTVGLTQPAWK